MIRDIRIEEFDYALPDDKIAKYPLERRDSSKLLCYKDGFISEDHFSSLPEYLPDNCLMVFNDTKVVPARLNFRKATGAHIEIFCLEPVLPAEYQTMFTVTGSCRWKCIVGNVKRWKGGEISLYNPQNSPEINILNLRARLVERDGETSVIEFVWDGGVPFSKVLEMGGKVPIPPYLNRETEAVDLERYQTLYARYRGSVAAPTAGLHFTEEVLDNIRKKGILEKSICLHVGAGTFLPVKSSLVSEHTMHREPFIVTLDLLEALLKYKGRIIAVGTTSVRTLESLYYAGVKCIENGAPGDVGQWEPYEREYTYSFEEAINAIVDYLKDNGLEELSIGTRIIIVPGFVFRAVSMLVTNFHQPQSTLLLLISAFVGGDWRRIYDYALSHDFRFLSYGDSSILYKRDK